MYIFRLGKNPSIKSMEEDGRYSRQSLIPGWDQSKLDKCSVVLVGIGAIGSYVGTILASSGVKNITIIDFDSIELSNLNRQLLFRDEDIGKPKSKVAAERLKELNPEVNIKHINKKMEKVPSSIYEKANVIIACLDTFLGRRWINSMALRVKKPLILGGLFAFLGDAQVIFPFKTACFECQPLVSQEELAQACTPFGEERKAEREEEEEALLPAVATLSSIIGGFMSQEAMKIILGIGQPLQNYVFYDGLSNVFTQLELAQNPECPACGELYRLEQVKFIATHGEKIRDLIVRLAWTYGLAKPDLLFKGKILEHEKTIEETKLKNNARIFILDKNLAKPIKILLKLKK
jgi:molybdopterin/thiamine biosynthesis adenylyltransferase